MYSALHLGCGWTELSIVPKLLQLAGNVVVSTRPYDPSRPFYFAAKISDKISRDAYN
jgi:hypothetical protein